MAAVAANTNNVLTFCESDCTKLWVQNDADLTVKSVVVRQSGDNEICVSSKRVHSQNLAGDSGNGRGEWFTIKANKACDYNVTFKTSAGCTGDKIATMTSSKIKDGMRAAILKQRCGGLKARVRVDRNYPAD